MLIQNRQRMQKIGMILTIIFLSTSCYGTQESHIQMADEINQEEVTYNNISGDSDKNSQEDFLDDEHMNNISGDETTDSIDNQRHVSLFNAIVIEGLLIGGSHNQLWKTTDEIEMLIEGGESYTLYSKDSELGVAQGSLVVYGEPNEVEMIDILSGNPYLVAVSSDWAALPRTIEKQSNDQQIYNDIFQTLLEENSINVEEVTIDQNYRIDLEGDGVDEVLLTVSNMDFDSNGFGYEMDTYSGIILRKIIDGEVKNLLIKSTYSIYNEDSLNFSDVHQVLAVIDLNGDGVLEIVVESRYYEGFYYTVYELVNHIPTEVLVNGAGA